MPNLRNDDTYSAPLSFIYVFNLIVGTGALALPAAFSAAGWLLGIIIIIALAFMSYLTVTFVIEAMAIANALVHYCPSFQRVTASPKRTDNSSELSNPSELSEEDAPEQRRASVQSERLPLLIERSPPEAIEINPPPDLFRITDKIELAKMASMFFPKWGVKLFFLFLAIYLYGDLSIYITAVSKSLQNVTCTYQSFDVNGTSNLSQSDPCWERFPNLERINVYRIFVTLFLFLLGPFTFFNVQKTKYLQMLTTCMRWIAFSIMIIIALILISNGEAEGHPSMVKISGLPTLFGVSVYAFMCHHSIPSLLTPIRNKTHMGAMLLLDYLLILAFYLLLSLTGIFAFSDVDSLYTLNFKDSSGQIYHPALGVKPIQYFLALFPVFTLSTSFPIIGITLQSNLKSLFLNEQKSHSIFVNRILFPLIAILPPFVISQVTDDVALLVGLTGSYAGAMVQYVIPTSLVYFARKKQSEVLGPGLKNIHQSPFKHFSWIIFVFIWTIACIVFVTVHLATK